MHLQVDVMCEYEWHTVVEAIGLRVEGSLELDRDLAAGVHPELPLRLNISLEFQPLESETGSDSL